MRNTLLFVFAFLSVNFLVFSQDPQIDYAGELVKSVEIPQSPEAAAFEKYGNVGVNMFTGTPNVSVPIYTINGKEMDLPISLNYDASGVKVEQLASQVGLSWTLSVGGRISRVVNGMPDNYSNGDYASIFKTASSYSTQTVRNNIINYASISTDFNSLQAGQNYLTFLNDISKNNVDTEPDYYSINVPGLSDYIVFDLNTMLPKAMKNSNLKIQHYFGTNGVINKWIVTSDNGTLYHFEANETTWADGNDITGIGGIIKEYASSWVLTKIESPNKKDVYEFTYNTNNTPFNYWTQPGQIGAASVTNTDYIGSGITQFNFVDTQVLFSPTYKIKQLYLTQITHNTRVIVNFELGSREDIDKTINSALKSVTIYDFNNQALKKYDLHQSYFGVNSIGEATGKQVHEVRLKLDSIQVLGSDLNRYTSYQFEYFSPASLTHTRSTSQDYLGYYNGESNGNNLYPDVTIEGLHFNGAIRTVDLESTKKGTLKKVTYPTGGTTEFSYSLHSALSPPQTNTTDVIYGYKSLGGGNGDAGDIAECGNCCQDKFQTAPKIAHTIFQISDPDTYKITYLEVGGNADAEAYIIPVSGSNSYIDYDSFTNPIYCTADNAFWQDNNGPPGPSTSAHFPAGFYQITLVNKTPGTTLSLKIHRLETNTTSSNESLAGLRVGRTIDNPGMGQPTIEKTYQYTSNITQSASSGKKIFNPKLSYFTSTVVQENGLPVTKITLNRVGQAAGGNQPHVVYSTVYEIEENNGYIAHNFKTGADGVVARSGPPFSNKLVSNFEVGKESSAHIYSASNTLVTSDIKKYENTFLYSELGFGITTEASRKFQFAAFEHIGSIYRLTYIDALITPQGLNLPALCNNSNITCMINPELAILEPFNTLASGKTGHLYKNEVYSYYENGTTNKVIDYLYNTDNLLKETITTDSEDNEIKTKNYYSGDFQGTAVYDDMVDENRLNTIVKTESYYNNIKTGTQETAYKKWSPNVYLPQTLKASKDNLLLEERLEYHGYYTNGNVKEVSLKNGAKSVYIWGYDETFPIAKIENASYSEVSSQVSNLQSKSNLDTDRTIGSTGTEGTLRTALTNLRNSLPNAMVTTYTYDPLIGVTSITDPSGQTVYYQYDDFNRLTHVMDKDGKVLSKNEYNYNNQN